jgi:PncC family amidohydrolase
MGKTDMKAEERLNTLLLQRRMRIALAESCTGGLISARITDVAGASDYFEAGLITYSNRAKERFLSVPHDLLVTKGSVSAEVAGRMAEGVRAVTGADIGLSVTGIAGPGGGSAEKPVGTVYMGLAAEGKTLVRQHHFSGDRAAVRGQTSDAALKMALDFLEGRVA